MNNSQVTVVMPVYNGESHLAEAIDSALGQIACTVEIIVIDDGSTDASASIIQAYGAPIRYIKQANAGPAAARNLGVSMASYPWIAFLDADDIWEPNKLQLQLKAAQDSGSPFIYTNCRNFGDDRVSEERPPDTGSRDLSTLERLLLDNFITLSSVLVRRDLLQSVGGFRTDHHGTEDWDLWLRIAQIETRMAFVAEPLTRYRWQPESLSKDHLHMASCRQQTLEEAITKSSDSSTGWKLLRQARANVMATSAWFAEDELPRQSLIWYCQSLLQWPFCAARWKATIKTAVKAVTRTKTGACRVGGVFKGRIAADMKPGNADVSTGLPTA
ncbi:glycosyltransferase family 2 protein [Fuerstiella marisgermanici]|uniref:Putative glycosyltransferase EpsJ n=1 Tax=Fuerstiella marisgermanici TaxID=1891926 RepID=A0A1P8WGM4_9PLAN|nr:glycosyltransferase family A protein [Fuerstiella marisgermanici]APZ93194.1 putative glycosyltransferase EpsJ [Fuerstiella marisgermanici]